MVEATGLEPAASWSQTKHSTKLSYASLISFIIIPVSTRFVNPFYKNCKIRFFYQHYYDYCIKL